MKSFKYIISCFLAIGLMTFSSISVFADENGTTYIKPNDAANNAANNSTYTGSDTKVTTSTFIKVDEAATNAGVEGTTYETTYVTVTDAEGNPVTDADGNPVTEVSYIDGEESTEEVTAGTVYSEMEGQVTYRELEEDDYAALERIKSELENEKKSQFDGVFGTLTIIAGVIIIVYTVAILLAFIIDKLNIVPDFEVTRMITLNHAVTLRDESDKDYVKSNKSDIYILTNKTIIINTAVGFLAGVLLFNVDKLVSIVQLIYNAITEW